MQVGPASRSGTAMATTPSETQAKYGSGGSGELLRLGFQA